MDQETIDIAERYLAGELSQTETAEFEKQMAENPALAAAIEKLRAEDEAPVTEPETEAPDPPAEKPSKRPFMKRAQNMSWWWMALAGMVMIAGVWLMQTSPDINTNTLFATYYRPGDLPVNYQGPNSPYPKDMQTAFGAFREGNYEGAQEILVGYQNDSLFGQQARIFIAHTQLLLKQNSEAVGTLTALTEEALGDQKQESQWLLCMAYLQAGNVQGAWDVATQIAETSQHPHRQEAQSVLAKLPDPQEDTPADSIQ